MLYSEADLENSMSKIETINFHQEVEIEGIKFWCYHAGHVLGAAMFMIEIAGVRVITSVWLIFIIFGWYLQDGPASFRYCTQETFQEWKIGI